MYLHTTRAEEPTHRTPNPAAEMAAPPRIGSIAATPTALLVAKHLAEWREAMREELDPLLRLSLLLQTMCFGYQCGPPCRCESALCNIVGRQIHIGKGAAGRSEHDQASHVLDQPGGFQIRNRGRERVDGREGFSSGITRRLEAEHRTALFE